MTRRRFQEIVLGVTAILALVIAAFRLGEAFVGPSASPPTGSGAIAVDSSNNVGIGTSTPAKKLHIHAGDLRFTRTLGGTGTFAVIEAYNSGGGGEAVSINLIRDATTNWDYGAVTFETLNTERMRITSGGLVGIGTSTPQALLSVGTTTTGLVAIFGGGSGKINAGTIDPVYTIGGEQYATYLPGMTGVKEETTGILSLAPAGGGVWSATIDFADEPRGSDLWLFSKTTNLREQFSRMAVLLTPAFDGTVWYEKDTANQRLILYAKPSLSSVISHRVSLEVSYRLTAPRFDAAEWPNVNQDAGSVGFVINE